jgi:hypothetical protein
MHAMQAPILQPALDRMPMNALVDELLPRHPPMLSRRDPSGRVEVASHTEA